MTAVPVAAPVPAVDAQEKSFNAALDIVKLFTTLSSGALAFSIGLTAQSTNNYPGALHAWIVFGWFIFFLSILAGVVAQMNAPRLIKQAQADPNARDFRLPAALAVVLFVAGVALLSLVLLATARYGPAGTRLVVASPSQAIAKALGATGLQPVAKVSAAEYLKGVDPVRPDQASWHVQFDLKTANAAAAGTTTLDVYVDPVSGCTYVVQQTPHVRGAPCAGF